MAEPELSVDQLWELREAALKNAKRLAEDAALLMSRGRWPGAYESAYFAREEIGKAAVVLLAVSLATKDPALVKWPGFWKAMKDHPTKSAGFVMMSRLYERLFESTEADAAAKGADTDAEKREAYELRMEREAALYVRWDDGIRTPWDSIPEGRAREMVAQARKMVDAELASTDTHRATIDAAVRGDAT